MSESIKYVNAACGMKQDVVPRCRMKRETPVAVLGASCASVPRTAPSGERLALREAFRAHGAAKITAFLRSCHTCDAAAFKHEVMV